MARRAHEHRDPTAPLPTWAATSWAGLIAGGVFGLVDGLVAIFVEPEALPSLGNAALATVSLVGLYVPPALLAALLVRLHLGRRVAARGAGPSPWRRDPEAVAALVAGGLHLAGRGALGALLAAIVPQQFARAVYGNLALGLALAAAGWLLVQLRDWIEPPLRRAARWLGPLASPGRMGLLLGLLGLIGVWIVAASVPELRRALGLGPLLAGTLGTPLALGAGALALPRVRRGPAALAWLVALAIFLGCGFAYGLRYGHRPLVENRSGFGRWALGGAQAAFDWDRDGSSRLFGGGDCDDFDAAVHPGAWDAPGDGVDADCLAGDSNPAVLELGDGAFGRRSRRLPRLRFLVITIDALRPDRLGRAGHPRELTPNIDALAEHGSWFADVTASSSRSIRSIPGFWSGFPPSQIVYGTGFQWPRLEDANEMVPELLRDADYDTSAVVGTTYFTRARGFFQGWEHVFQGPEYQPDPRLVTDRALLELERLAKGERPWILWVHLFNVHRPHRHAERRFGDTLRDTYAAVVVRADELVGRLLAELEAQGERERTAVIVASDHGEALGEHGVEGHATTLYDVETRSTLVIDVPGLPTREVLSPVGLIDVAPTLMNLAGVRPSRSMPARSLLPLMRGERQETGRRSLISELLPDGRFAFDQKALREGDYRLIWSVRSGAFQLFDIASDPGELNDLIDARPEVAERMRGRLVSWAALANAGDRREQIVRDARLEAIPDEMDVRLDARVPGLRIHGFDIASRDVRLGGTIEVTFYLEATRRMAKNYMIDLVFEDPRGRQLPEAFEGVHVPVHGLHPTTEWEPGELIRDEIEIIVPPDLPAPVELEASFGVREGDQYRLPFKMGSDGTRVFLHPVGTLDVRP
ncbi:MAG: sulfatase-like hydrolase/transferase [Myxococcota bacterium]